LDDYFFNQGFQHEIWLATLESFVKSLSNNQKLVLKSKFSNKLSNLSKNDLLHEIMVACAFYPKAIFNADGGADLIDDQNHIEIKTINASSVEIERIKVLVPNSQRPSIPKDNQFQNRFENKFNLRFQKATQQVKHEGIIYIVWDSDNVVGWNSRKQEIEILLKRLVEKNKINEPKIIVKAIYFGDLRELLK